MATVESAFRAAAACTLVAVVLVLASCSSGKNVTRRTLVTPTTAPSAWTGRTVEEVERVWGKATDTESDGEGGRVLVYRGDTSFTVSASSGNAQQPRELPSDPERTTSETIQKDLAKFWVDAGGTVYRTWFAPAVYDSGKDEPPPRQPAE